MLCNDRAVLGPWVNRRGTNVFTSAVISVLVALSTVLTTSVLFPDISSTAIVAILAVGAGLGMLGAALLAGYRRYRGVAPEPVDRAGRAQWRMPPLALLGRPGLSTGRRVGLAVLRTYLLIASVLVVVRVAQLALNS